MLDIDATLTRKIVKYIRGSKAEQTRSKPWNIFSSKFFYRYDSPFYTCNSWSLRSFFPFSFLFSHLVRRLRVQEQDCSMRFHWFIARREERSNEEASQPRWRLLRQRSAAQSRTWHGFFLRRRFTHRDQAWICYSRDSRGSNGDLKCPWSLSRRETRTKALNLSSLRLQFLLDEFFSLKHIGHLFHPIPYLLFLPA